MEAIGTVRQPHLVGWLQGTMGRPHPFTEVCQSDGEGHGPCFDARWIEEHESEGS